MNGILVSLENPGWIMLLDSLLGIFGRYHCFVVPSVRSLDSMEGVELESWQSQGETYD